MPRILQNIALLSNAEILVKLVLKEDMLRIYNRVDSEIKGYATKMRKAFTKESNFLEDMWTALVFKQRNEYPIEIFEKVKKLVDKIFTSKLTTVNWCVKGEGSTEITYHVLYGRDWRCKREDWKTTFCETKNRDR